MIRNKKVVSFLALLTAVLVAVLGYSRIGLSGAYVDRIASKTISPVNFTNIGTNSVTVGFDYYVQRNSSWPSGNSLSYHLEDVRGTWEGWTALVPYRIKVIALDPPAPLPEMTYGITSPQFVTGSSTEQWRVTQTINLPFSGTKYAVWIEKATSRYDLEKDQGAYQDSYAWATSTATWQVYPVSETYIIQTAGAKPALGTEEKLNLINSTLSTRLDQIRASLDAINTQVQTVGVREGEIRDKLQLVVNSVNSLVSSYNNYSSQQVTELQGIKGELAKDRTPPVLSLAWPDGATITSSSSKTLNIFAEDNGGGSLQMKLNGGAWQPYSSTVSVPLSLGRNVVVVSVRDAALPIPDRRWRLGELARGRVCKQVRDDCGRQRYTVSDTG